LPGLAPGFFLSGSREGRKAGYARAENARAVNCAQFELDRNAHSNHVHAGAISLRTGGNRLPEIFPAPERRFNTALPPALQGSAE